MKTFSSYTHYKKILADTITPVSIYLKIRDKFPNSILLESSDYHANDNSFSYICCNPIASIEVKDETIYQNYPDGSSKINHVKTVSVVEEIQKFTKRFKVENNKEFIEENDWILEKLIITLDKDGCMYKGTMYPTEQVEIMDISGAGDTFVAGFVKMFLDTKDIPKSIQFANRCSAQVVQKRGVTTIDYENL